MIIPDKQRLYTVEEFEAFLAQPENADRLFELIQGEIIEKMPPQLHAAIIAILLGEIYLFLKVNPIAWVLPDARYRVPEDEHNSRIPDISVVLDRSRPLVEKGAAPYIPDLAIEVQSPDDSLKKMREKADYYLANGARMVWLVYTQKRLVEVLTPDDRQLLNEADTLDGGDVLPGFMLNVHDIFPQQ